MRLELRIDLGRIAPCAVICTAIALFIAPVTLRAQQSNPAESATVADFADHPAHGSLDVHDAASAERAIVEPGAATTAQIRHLAGTALSIPGDVASVNDISLDDQMLSRQRGGAVGMLMVAATPQLMRANGSSVTLWDEIAPPSPLPVPVDAARAAQGNVASYQRK